MIAVELVWPTAAILVVEEREIGRARASWADQEVVAAPSRGLIAVAARRVAPASAAAPAAEASAAAEEPEVAEAGGAAEEAADADDKFDPDLEFSG